MRELREIYQIVQDEILRSSSQFYIKDKINDQPILISFKKNPKSPKEQSSLYTIIEGSNIIPFYDRRYNGTIKIIYNDQKYEIRAIDSYYMNFLIYHATYDRLFDMIPSISSKLYNDKSMIYTLGSEVSSVIDVLFNRRVRNQLCNRSIKCLVDTTNDSKNGIFEKTEFGTIYIRTADEIYYISINFDTLNIFTTSTFKNDNIVFPVKILEPIGVFLINCIIITGLKNRNLTNQLIISRLNNLIDFARPMVNDLTLLGMNDDNLQTFYSEIEKIAKL